MDSLWFSFTCVWAKIVRIYARMSVSLSLACMKVFTLRKLWFNFPHHQYCVFIVIVLNQKSSEFLFEYSDDEATRRSFVWLENYQKYQSVISQVKYLKNSRRRKMKRLHIHPSMNPMLNDHQHLIIVFRNEVGATK